VVLPGTHTVTVANRVLTSELVLVGPASTTTLTTLEPLDVELPVDPVEELPDVDVPPDDNVPPPPQDSTDMHSSAQNPKRQARDGAPKNALPTLT
jgi:hypothetical protein